MVMGIRSLKDSLNKLAQKLLLTDKVVEMTRRYFLNRGNASTRISDRRPLKEIPLSPRRL